MNLLFIDDEEESRKGIEKYINWEKLGIDRVISFSSPFAALEYIEKEPVDIVLSDIRMPLMDGIELCRSILKKVSSISIIFISGYSDKEYLMNAIQMSAVDYIEKPVNIPKLEAAIERAVKRQLRDRSMKQHENAWGIIQKNQQQYVDQLVSDLVHGKFSLSEHRPVFMLQDSLASQIVPLNDKDFYRVYLWSSGENVLGFQKAVKDICCELCQSEIVCSSMIGQKDERTLIQICRFADPLECDAQKIELFLQEALYRARMQKTVSCTYGHLKQGIAGIRESYHQAVLAKQRIFFLGYGRILPYLNSEKTYELQTPALQLLQEGLQQQNEEKCRLYLEAVYQNCREQKGILPDLIRDEYFKILSVIDQSVLELPEIAGWRKDDTQEYLWQRISSFETLEECHISAMNKLDHIFNNLNEMISERKIILEIIRIVRENYSDHELCINQIAEQVYMTPNYLSTLFKKETGKTIGTYITEIRLEQSQKLLAQSDMKLSDIVRAVGYSDTNYFSKLFKKNCHMTPSEYRKRFRAM